METILRFWHYDVKELFEDYLSVKKFRTLENVNW